MGGQGLYAPPRFNASPLDAVDKEHAQKMDVYATLIMAALHASGVRMVSEGPIVRVRAAIPPLALCVAATVPAQRVVVAVMLGILAVAVKSHSLVQPQDAATMATALVVGVYAHLGGLVYRVLVLLVQMVLSAMAMERAVRVAARVSRAT